MGVKTFFSQKDQQQIVDAIINAENNTSAEIRVQVDKYCKGDVVNQAKKHFEKLNMHKTILRNGVLFYLSIEDKKFAVLGDEGINKKVPENFWDNIRDLVITYFKKQEYTPGLVTGINMAGEQLKFHFPRLANDKNELHNDLSFE